MMRTSIAGILLVGFVHAAAAEDLPATRAGPPPVAQAVGSGAAEAKDAAAAVRNVAMVLMFTRVIGVTGIEKSPAAAGKQLAHDVATANAALLTELKAAAAVSGYAAAIPDVLDARYAGQAELLQSSFETQFEHEYLGMQIAAHREAIAALDSARPGLAAVSSLDGVARKVSGRLTASLAGLEAAKRALPAM